MLSRWPVLPCAILLASAGCEATPGYGGEGALEGWAALGLPQAPKGGDDITGPYELVEGWPANACGEGWQGGAVGGVFAESADRVFVFQRGCLPALPPAAAIVPTRNTAQFDLSASDPERHPRWDHVLMIFDRGGNLVDSWERHNHLFVRPFGAFPGGMWGPHQFSVDEEGSLYVADVHVGRVQKFRPKAGVNPALLVGR